MSSSSPEMDQGSGGGKKFKGVRKRKWGKWVSEIRLPNSRERIWLGSYDAPEKAARAFDAAFVCLRGPGADLNFPDSPPPPCRAAGGCSSDPQEVQAAALSHANRAAVTAQQAAAALMDDANGGGGPALPREWADSSSSAAAAAAADEVVAPVRADGSIDWRPVMAHPPPLFSPTGWGGSNAYDFLLVPPTGAADEDMMEDYSIHGASASLWSFDLRDSYFRY
ncbi:unnamed protein product [Urochloa humidicola]